jgi:hypothetical protein
MLSFEQPIILAFILPVLAGALYLMLKGGNKKLLISRAIVLSLLIVAIASPFTLVSQVTEQENPQLVIISDETGSMQLFEEGVADELYESLTTKTPTTLVRLTGDKTALGDTIVQYASSDNQVVLVTDGNNNYGENLENSLQYADRINSTVYAVTPETQHNDMSVRIEGEKTAVLGEYIFDIVVEHANRDLVDYSINLYVDGDKKNGLLNTITPYKSTGEPNQIKPIRPVEFDTTGAHNLTVELIPKSEDYDSINNKFTKSVYVVPKPKVQYVTGESYNSAFARDLNQLYTPVTDDNFSRLDGKKAVIIDNLYIDALNENDIANLQKYVTNGGGLVVIGGGQSYNNGEYRNSSLEKLLPVYSYPTENIGGEVVVLVIDKSGSGGAGTEKSASEGGRDPSTGYLTEKENPASSTYIISYIKESAKNVTKNPDFSDAKMGIIAFDNEGHILSQLQSLNKKSNQKDIGEIIDSIGAGSGSDLGAGLQKTAELLEDVPGQKIIMILSDGRIEEYYSNSIQQAQSLQENHNVAFQFFRFSDPYGTDYAEKFIQELEGEAVLGENYFIKPEGFTVGDIKPDSPSPPDPPPPKPDPDTYLLVEYNPTHFISKNSEVSNVTFYNGATAKPGSERVVLAENGNPVITTWRYGLGRVASVTTDHNNFGNQDNLTAATLNWAVADPQPEEGAVVEAPDTWYGLPATITVTTYNENVPILRRDDTGEKLDIAFVGKNTYEASMTPKTIGMYHVNGYPIAVNYALEYRDVGLNEKLPSLINQNDGKVYDSIQQARAKLLEDARQNSLQSRMEPVSWKMYFILAALLLFLGEVMLRRSMEIIESRKQE